MPHEFFFLTIIKNFVKISQHKSITLYPQAFKKLLTTFVCFSNSNKKASCPALD